MYIRLLALKSQLVLYIATHAGCTPDSLAWINTTGYRNRYSFRHRLAMLSDRANPFCHAGWGGHVFRVLRRIFAREHTLGIAAYRSRNFEEALSHFEKSYRVFSAHRTLDARRSLAFGVASQNSYRVIALGNMAYCFGQMGDRAKAIDLYEQVLREVPDHAVAVASLNMLRAGDSKGDPASERSATTQATAEPA
jgi:tetratricopeptide (TPR) repeat protein